MIHQPESIIAIKQQQLLSLVYTLNIDFHTGVYVHNTNTCICMVREHIYTGRERKKETERERYRVQSKMMSLRDHL